MARCNLESVADEAAVPDQRCRQEHRMPIESVPPADRMLACG